MDVGNICNPLAVWPVCSELTLQQVFLLMYLLAHIDPLATAADFRQQTILFHDSEDGFRVLPNISVSQPFPDPPVAVGLVGLILTLLDLPEQGHIPVGDADPLHKIIVATPGHSKEFAHDRYRVLVPVPID